MLIEELRQIRRNLIHNEDRLAQLHAGIYKRREEARKIRLSMPTPEYLDNVQLTQDVIEKLEKKKKKTLCSLLKLQENTTNDLQKYSHPTHFWVYFQIVLWVVILILLGLYLATRVMTVPARDPSIACH
jgi:hypothetical protein